MGSGTWDFEMISRALVCNSMIAIDVLHTLDLGISQDALGTVFHTFWNSILAKTNNKLTKAKELWDRSKSYYQRVHPPTTLDGLSVEI